MKKLLFLTLSFTLMLSTTVNAQTTEDTQASKARLEKLQQMSVPEKVGVAGIDQLSDEANTMLQEALAITKEIETFNAHLRGEEVEGEEIVVETEAEGEEAEEEIFPTMEDCEALMARIETQGGSATTLATTAIDALKDVKKLKSPMKIAKGTKSLKYSQEVVKLVGEEAVFQVKALNDIIKTVNETAAMIAG